MRIADYSVTRAVLERHGFTFKKSFGQNFLTDTNILQKIVDTAEIDENVNVIEIGPGIGALTEFLAENAAEVMTFEIDERLVPILADTLRDFDNVRVVNEDILKSDLQARIKEFANPNLPIKVVANLPYYITTPILMHLIESGIPFSEFVVMMQREVADRISAQPNSKSYGSLSIAVQYYMTAKVALSYHEQSLFLLQMWIRLSSRWSAETSQQLGSRMKFSSSKSQKLVLPTAGKPSGII